MTPAGRAGRLLAGRIHRLPFFQAWVWAKCFSCFGSFWISPLPSSSALRKGSHDWIIQNSLTILRSTHQ